MKSALFPIVLLALALGSAPAAQATTVVSGHIIHPRGDKVSLEYAIDPLTGQPGKNVSGKLDAKGNFRLELTGLTAPSAAVFSHGEFTSLYLAPGDNLVLTLDTEHFDQSVRFSGKGSAACNYLAQSYLKFDNDYEATPLAKAATSTPAAMRQLADAYRQRRLAYLNTYAATHPLAPGFRAYARQAIAFNWAGMLFYYPEARQQATPTDVPALPAGYYDFLATVRPAQDSALRNGNGDYLQFMDAYMRAKASAAGPALTGEGLVAAAGEQFGPGPSRDVALTKYVLQFLYEHEATDLTPLLPAVQRSFRDSAAARTVRGRYRELLPFAAGKVAPAFTVRDASGKAVNLADYKSKVVYLDFWASWCGPCMAEVPASVALKKKFEGQDVVFLYVSIDDKEANWKKALDTKPLQSANSVHTLDKGWQAPTPKAYQVTGIPAYFVIGRDGTFATGHAHHPSEGEATVQQLNAALAKK